MNRSCERIRVALDLVLADPQITGTKIAAALGVADETGCAYRQRALDMIAAVRRNDRRVAAERAASERVDGIERRKAERRGPKPVIVAGLVIPVLIDKRKKAPGRP